MHPYEIQTKVDGRWTQHAVLGEDEAGALHTWRYLAGTLSVPARLVTHDYKGRVHVVRRQAARKGYRVVYGETAPVWSRVLPTRAKADEFAAKHRSFGDIIFSIEAA